MDTKTVESNISFDEKEKVDKSVDKKEAPILTDIPITDENIALNVLVSFLNLGQRRGSAGVLSIFKNQRRFGSASASFSDLKRWTKSELLRLSPSDFSRFSLTTGA